MLNIARAGGGKKRSKSTRSERSAGTRQQRLRRVRNYGCRTGGTRANDDRRLQQYSEAKRIHSEVQLAAAVQRVGGTEERRSPQREVSGVLARSGVAEFDCFVGGAGGGGVVGVYGALLVTVDRCL